MASSAILRLVMFFLETEVRCATVSLEKEEAMP